MYMKTKELGWKENHRIQNTGIKYLQGNTIVDQRQVLKIWELYIQPNRPENLDIEQKRPLYFAKWCWKSCQGDEVIRRLQEMMYLGMYSDYWEKMVSE